MNGYLFPIGESGYKLHDSSYILLLEQKKSLERYSYIFVRFITLIEYSCWIYLFDLYYLIRSFFSELKRFSLMIKYFFDIRI